MKNPFYPEMIDQLPDANIPFVGVKGKLFQGEKHQIVFFEIEPIGEIAEHTHGAQWGVVFSGDMDLTIDGKTSTYRDGDKYFIPAGVPHSANFKKKTFVMDFFEDKDRYSAKK